MSSALHPVGGDGISVMCHRCTGTTTFVPRQHGRPLSSVLVRDVPKSAKDMLVVEFTDLEIGGAAERYRTSVTKYLPKPSRTLYRGRRARAVNGFTRRDATVSEIEGQNHERNDLCHRLRTAIRHRPVCRCCPRLPVNRQHKVLSPLFMNCLTSMVRSIYSFKNSTPRSGRYLGRCCLIKLERK
jgi:hypothetical protein